MKKKMLGKSDIWSMRQTTHRPSKLAYYIEDCRIYNESANFLWCSLFWWFSNKRKKRKLISFKMSAHINMSERGHGVKQDKKRATTAIFSTFLADLLPVQKKVLCYPNRWCRRARKTRCCWAQKLTKLCNQVPSLPCWKYR